MLYFPILRTKQGEINALKNVGPAAKAAMHPILQVPPPDLDYDGNTVAPDSRYVQKIAKAIQPALAPGTGLVCSLNPAPANLTPALLLELLTAIAAYGGAPQPVYSLTGSLAYAQMQRDIIGQPHSAILRVGLDEIGGSLAKQIADAMSNYKLRPDQTVLLLDMGDVSLPGLPLRLYESTFSRAIADVSPLGLSGIIVASCALPAKTPDLPKWKAVQFPRHEIDVFRSIKAFSGYDVHFGDYALGNVITEPSPSRPGAPKIRYSTLNEYEVMKGQKPSLPPHTMSEQYNRLSLHLVAHPSYTGRTFSWGDDYIYKASQPGSQSRGNAATWVAVHTSHHLELVVSMLPSM